MSEVTVEQKLSHEVMTLKARLFDVQEQATEQMQQYQKALTDIVSAVLGEVSEKIDIGVVIEKIEELKSMAHVQIVEK